MRFAYISSKCDSGVQQNELIAKTHTATSNVYQTINLRVIELIAIEKNSNSSDLYQVRYCILT